MDDDDFLYYQISLLYRRELALGRYEMAVQWILPRKNGE